MSKPYRPDLGTAVLGEHRQLNTRIERTTFDLVRRACARLGVSQRDFVEPTLRDRAEEVCTGTPSPEAIASSTLVYAIATFHLVLESAPSTRRADFLNAALSNAEQAFQQHQLSIREFSILSGEKTNDLRNSKNSPVDKKNTPAFRRRRHFLPFDTPLLGYRGGRRFGGS